MALRTTNVMGPGAAATEASMNWDQLYFLNESVSVEPHVIVTVAQGQENKSLSHITTEDRALLHTMSLPSSL